MNRKDPDKKGKAFGIYLTAEAKAIYLATPDKLKGKMVSRAIVAWNNRCEHLWEAVVVRGLHENISNGNDRFETVCSKCGVKLEAIIENIKL